MSAMSDNGKVGGWQTGKSSRECRKFMLENHVSCDVTIRFPASTGSSSASSFDREMRAHAFMLICRSPVFETMLIGSYHDHHSTITVTDVTPEVFMEILRFVYYDGAVLCGDNVLHIMYAAKKYLLEGLIMQCRRYLDEELTEQSACTILSHSLLYNEGLTTKRCLSYMAEHTEAVFLSADFVNLTVNALEQVFGSEDIMCAQFKETDLFRACIAWAKNMRQSGDKRSVRDILGKFLYEIRFATLLPDELTKIIDERPGLLNQKEQSVLLRYVNLPTDRKGSEIERLGFSTRRRGANANAVVFATPNRFALTTDYFVYNGKDTCEISFQVNNPVEFVGVTLYGGFTKGDQHSVHLALYTKSGVQQLGSAEVTISSHGTSDPLQVTLPAHVPLTKHTVYTIKVLMTGPHSFRGTLGRKEVRTEGVTFRYQDVTGSSTCVEKGQIPQILFKVY